MKGMISPLRVHFIASIRKIGYLKEVQMLKYLSSLLR